MGHRMKTIDPTPHSAAGPESAETLVSALEAMWDRGERPDVRTVLTTRGGSLLALDGLLAILHVDQRRRWLAGERIDIRSYARNFPAVANDLEAFFGLLYHEILIREGLGERPDPGEYERAFPELAERLRMQMEVHERFRATTSVGPGPTGRRKTASRVWTASTWMSRGTSCSPRSVGEAWGSSTERGSSSPAGWSR